MYIIEASKPVWYTFREIIWLLWASCAAVNTVHCMAKCRVCWCTAGDVCLPLCFKGLVGAGLYIYIYIERERERMNIV